MTIYSLILPNFMLNKRIVILVFDGVNLLDASDPAQVFTQANCVAANRRVRYQIQLASKHGGLTACNSGINIETTSLKHIKLASNFPCVKVEPDPIYICDKDICSSAGISTGIDLALAMVEQDLGHESSLQTARELVVYLKRPGGQFQFSTPLQAQAADNSGIFNDLQVWIMNNLDKQLTTQQLAD